MTQYIKAPFNFVPLNEKVYFPDWADKISHDIPFEDSKSGVINLKITAYSPVFIRNGGEDKTVFSHYVENDQKKYFIPGSSLKGAIRNVLGIMSYGKMRVDKSMMFTRRDLMNPEIYPLSKDQDNIDCGWLKFDGEKYCIQDCGKPGKINHIEIDEFLDFKKKIFECNFRFDENDRRNNNLCDEEKLAKYKYELIEAELIKEKLEKYKRKLIDEKLIKEKLAKYKYELIESDGDTDYKGTIVFTGQPNKWKYPRTNNDKSKFHEYIFWDLPKKEVCISEKVWNEFLYIYKDSEDWSFWKPKIENKEEKGCPVFFRIKKDTNEVMDMGLCYLYKLPYENSVQDLLLDEHKKTESLDLAECLFGHTSNEEKKTSSLKGRVQFSHAFAVGTPKAIEPINLLLASPKASYYPLYIKQEGKSGKTEKYDTYNNNNNNNNNNNKGMLNGWKRYPVSGECLKNEGPATQLSKLTPLNSGTTFNMKVRYHNLRNVELGALLSAILFHNHSNCLHQLGQGKPYGYGKVKIELDGEDVETKRNYITFMGSFEAAMNKWLTGDEYKTSWLTSPPLKELFAMANNKNGTVDSYMKMSMKKEDNEFSEAKKLKEFLRRFTEINDLQDANIFPESLLPKE